MEPPAIWSHFEGLKDPRVERTRRHQLMDIVIISVLAVVAGADGWSDIVQFAEDRQDWFSTFLELPAGIPCDDTFRRVFAALDPVKFQAGFLSWAKCLVGSTEGGWSQACSTIAAGVRLPRMTCHPSAATARRPCRPAHPWRTVHNRRIVR